MIQLRLLNGELIQLDDDKSIAKDVAGLLAVYPSQVFYEKMDTENEYMLFIHPKPKVQLRISRKSSMDPAWLETAVNESILMHYLDMPLSNVPTTLLANPHPLVVDRVSDVPMQKLVQTGIGMAHGNIFANPSDVIVDRIIHNYDEIQAHMIAMWSRYHLSRNTNPRMVQYMISEYPHHIKTDEFLKQSHDLAVDFALQSIQCDKTRMSLIIENVTSESAISWKLHAARTCNVATYTQILMQAFRSKHPRLISWALSELDKQIRMLGMNQTIEMPAALLGNSNEMVVDWLFQHFDLVNQSNRDTNYLSENSHPRIVEWLFEDEETRIKFPAFLSNAHPRAVEYSKKHLNAPLLRRFDYRHAIVSNPNCDLLIWALHTFPEDLMSDNGSQEIEKKLSTIDTVIVEYI